MNTTTTTPVKIDMSLWELCVLCLKLWLAQIICIPIIIMMGLLMTFSATMFGGLFASIVAGAVGG